MNDTLREELAALAGQAVPVDLTDRVHETSRRIGRRRVVAATTGCFAAVVAVGVGAAVLPLRPDQPADDIPPYALPTGPITGHGTGIAPKPGPLADATVAVPAWRAGSGCPSGSVRFTAGATTGAPTQLPRMVVLRAVEADGGSSLVAVLGCYEYERTDYQAVTMPYPVRGAVGSSRAVITTWGTANDVRSIFEVAAGPDGGVSVEVGDRGDADLDAAQHQWRTYRWTAGRYTQTSEPHTFPTYPSTVDLVVDVAASPYRPEPDGPEDIVFVNVGIANRGGVASGPVYLQLTVPDALEPAGDAGHWTGCVRGADPPAEKIVIECPVDAVEPGVAIRQYLFRYRAPKDWVVVEAYADQRRPGVLERDRSNNHSSAGFGSTP